MNEFVRPDFIFSYWIFLWWILYELNITTVNPKFIIILGIIHNLILLVFKLYGEQNVLSFIIINLFIKIIPIITLLNTQIQYNDIIFSIYLFLIYLLWIAINYKTIISYFSTKSPMPFEYFFKYFYEPYHK